MTSCSAVVTAGRPYAAAATGPKSLELTNFGSTEMKNVTAALHSYFATPEGIDTVSVLGLGDVEYIDQLATDEEKVL